MNVTHKITMDLTRPTNENRINVVEGDKNSRIVNVHLYENFASWRVPTNASVLIKWERESGVGGEYSQLSDGSSAWSAVGNILTITLSDESTEHSGNVKFSIVLTSGDSQISTFVIIANVHAVANGRDGTNSGTSSTDIAGLQKQIGNLSNLETKNKSNLVAAINEAAKSGSGTGTDGEDGGYYTPKVSQPTAVTMLVEHTPSKAGMPAVEPVTIDLPVGSDSSQNVNGLSAAQIAALDGMFKVAAYIKDDVSAEYNAFKTAFGISGSGGGEEEPDVPDVPVVETYIVSKELVNVTSNNGATSVTEGASYTATLTASDGYTLEGATVIVTMGGVDVTAEVYSNGIITIDSVTGNIVIIATAAMQGLSEYTVTNNLNGVSNSNAETTISEGGTYSATLTADDSHVLPDVDMGGSIVITMGGTDITNSVYTYSTGAIGIAPVTGNIVITVAAADKPVIITDGLQDLFDYRNAEVNANGDIESVIGDGLILDVGTSADITADGFMLNHSYDSTGARTDYVNYDGTNHEWTAFFCYMMGSSGTYSVPFPDDAVKRGGVNHYPIGNYYNTEGTEVAISYDTAVANNTVGAKLIGVIRNGATERAFFVAKQKNATVEQVAIFNASDYSDFAYFSPLSYRHRPVSRTRDRSMLTAIYKRALTDDEIAEVIRYMKMEVA